MTELRSLYDKRYTGEMRFQTSRPGTHSVVMEAIADMLPGALVLDVGCGAGRLCLRCALKELQRQTVMKSLSMGDARGRCFIIIAEVAQAHDGSLGMPHAFIDAIGNAGADAVKYQTHIAAVEREHTRSSNAWKLAPFQYPLSKGMSCEVSNIEILGLIPARGG